jgi:hypothetical protein
MTCIEKFREMHPEYGEVESVVACNIVAWDCPSCYGIMADPAECVDDPVYTCRQCWDREVEE